MKQQFLQLVLKRGNAATMQRLFLTVARLSPQQRLLQWRNGKESKNEELKKIGSARGTMGRAFPSPHSPAYRKDERNLCGEGLQDNMHETLPSLTVFEGYRSGNCDCCIENSPMSTDGWIGSIGPFTVHVFTTCSNRKQQPRGRKRFNLLSLFHCHFTLLVLAVKFVITNSRASLREACLLLHLFPP